MSKRKALAIERKMWHGEECSFCGRIPPEFQACIHSKTARICNICVDEAYRDLLESEQVARVKPPRGDYYQENGFDHIASYISRLLVPTKKYKLAYIFAVDRMRGFAIIACGTIVQRVLYWMGIEKVHARPKFVHSSPQKVSILQVIICRITGTAEELTALTKTILQELCDVSPEEGLSIRLDEK